uniref:Methyltransferase n=1 Tax=viral metagenome TaxID=1070528 RepID=A0A6H1ZKV3_9ZZZZ
MLTVDIVNNTVRPGFEKNVAYVEQYLEGVGLDMGCGSCPLMKPNCLHFDLSPQPVAVDQVGDYFIRADTTKPFIPQEPSNVDYVFSSHMIEDLSTKDAIVQCLLLWATYVRPGGFIVLLLPDMAGKRYPTVEEGGNCSHKINVGRELFESMEMDLKGLKLVQIDTIPHDTSETIDIVFMKER